AAGRRVLQRCGRLLLRLNKSRQIIRLILHPRFGCTLGLPRLRTTADVGTAAANSQWYVNSISNGCFQSSYLLIWMVGEERTSSYAVLLKLKQRGLTERN